MVWPVTSILQLWRHSPALLIEFISCYKHLKQLQQGICILSKTCSIFRCLELMWFHRLPAGGLDFHALSWIGKKTLFSFVTAIPVVRRYKQGLKGDGGKEIYENIKYLTNIPNTLALLLSFRNVICVNIPKETWLIIFFSNTAVLKLSHYIYIIPGVNTCTSALVNAKEWLKWRLKFQADLWPSTEQAHFPILFNLLLY